MQKIKKKDKQFQTITTAEKEKQTPKCLCGTAQNYQNNAAFWQNNKLLSAKSRVKVAIFFCMQNATRAIAPRKGELLSLLKFKFFVHGKVVKLKQKDNNKMSPLTKRNDTGPPWGVTDDDRRRRQTPESITRLPSPTLCLGGLVIKDSE